MSSCRPIEFIQNTRPVVVIDVPQSMKSAGAKAAIERLNTFCTLRYSATHKTHRRSSAVLKCSFRRSASTSSRATSSSRPSPGVR